jgi:hypothetical protein
VQGESPLAANSHNNQLQCFLKARFPHVITLHTTQQHIKNINSVHSLARRAWASLDTSGEAMDGTERARMDQGGGKQTKYSLETAQTPEQPPLYKLCNVHVHFKNRQGVNPLQLKGKKENTSLKFLHAASHFPQQERLHHARGVSKGASGAPPTD